MLEIYRQACRVQRDGRLSDAGRRRKIAELEDAILELCAPLWALDLQPLEESAENDYRFLTNEIMRLALDEQLFTLVTTTAAPQPNGRCHNPALLCRTFDHCSQVTPIARRLSNYKGFSL
ncbi:hypothetical protein BH10PLA2_BH10PLA2_18730 [soil metagenome]